MKTINIVLTLAILVLGFFLFKGIKDPIDFQKEKRARYDKVIERLKEIRRAQVVYKSENGHYAEDFPTLIGFLKNGSLTVIKQIGNPDDSNAVVIRDTILVPVRDSLYAVDPARIDSLPFVPFGDGARFKMSAGRIEKGSVMVNVFEVIDTKPFDPGDVLKVGSMTEPTNAGNWE